MADTNVVSFLFEDIQPTVEAFVQDSSATMIGILGPLAAALFAMYVLLWGSALASGQISEPFTDGIKRIVRMAVIIALAMTVGVYNDFVAETLQEVPMEIAGELTFPGAAPASDANSMAALLDGVLEKGLEVSGKPWDEGRKKNSRGMVGITGEGIALQLLAVVLCIIAIITVCVAAGIVFVAYMALAILLAIGPLFILFAVFPATQRWAEAWLGQAVNYAVLFILVAVGSGLLFKILSAYFDTLNSPAGWSGNPIEVAWIALKAIGLSIAMLAVLLQLNSIAAGIAGGASIQTANVAGKLANMGKSAATGLAGAGGHARSAAGHARAAYRGFKGQETHRHARSSRELAHASGAVARSVAGRARQVFHKRNTIEGT